MYIKKRVKPPFKVLLTGKYFEDFKSSGNIQDFEENAELEMENECFKDIPSAQFIFEYDQKHMIKSKAILQSKFQASKYQNYTI